MYIYIYRSAYTHTQVTYASCIQQLVAVEFGMRASCSMLVVITVTAIKSDKHVRGQGIIFENIFAVVCLGSASGWQEIGGGAV